ncbi:MAG: thiamine-phosphate kinase [Hydrogenophilus sp.]|nr:thiamine-phosphate kinase [Hydrogenophilus sp.]
MSLDEFALIARYFFPLTPSSLLVGDDAALLPCPLSSPHRPSSSPSHLVLTTDTLVVGTHFHPDVAPSDLGWKALAVNLSDLAAMGAEPVAYLLSLTLPAVDDSWLAAFTAGLAECARCYQISLIGGDTTRGPLTITITAIGSVPPHQALRRDTAQAGDQIWISGFPGRAALGLAVRTGQLSPHLPGARDWLAALDRPTPRLALGQSLRGLATAALDCSDGLTQDLMHLLDRRPDLSILLEEEALPLTPLTDEGAPLHLARTALLNGGDDYELIFTAPPAAAHSIAALAHRLQTPLTSIGTILPRSAHPLLLRRADGTAAPLPPSGWRHF